MTDKSIKAGQWIIRTQHRPILGEDEHEALVDWLRRMEGDVPARVECSSYLHGGRGPKLPDKCLMRERVMFIFMFLAYAPSRFIGVGNFIDGSRRCEADEVVGANLRVLRLGRDLRELVVCSA